MNLTPQIIKEQSREFEGTGGVSAENRGSGFLPAFREAHTGRVYLSRFANGRLAPMHLLDGLPAKLIAQQTESGHVASTNNAIAAGFVRDERFYTREQAANAAKTLPLFSNLSNHLQ